ncbi:MAG: DUF4836 family protein [Prevotellaceae bacterium]|jgi:hypothetical protein|nr:DUF4836 family protein [Prevotellaceae bacterium]
MRKNLFASLCATALLALTIAACTSPKVEAYTNAIPRDAMMVFGMNVQSLGEKSGFLTDELLTQKITDIVSSEIDAATLQKLEAIMSAPGESGLDAKSPFYYYLQEFNAHMPAMGLVGKVLDEQKLHATIEAFGKEGLWSAPAKGDGYTFSTIEENGIIAFNAQTFILRPTITDMEQVKQEIAAQLKQTAEQGIASTEAFKKLRAMNGDMEFLIGYDKFFEQIFSSTVFSAAERAELGAAATAIQHFKDCQMLATLNCEAGKFTSKYEMVTDNPQTAAYMEENAAAMMPLKNRFLKNFAQASPLLFSMGCDGAKMYDLILKSGESFRPDVAALFKSEAAKTICGMFKGDVTFGITDIPMGLPTFLLLAEVTDAAPLNALVAQVPGVKKEKENEYSYAYMGMFTFYFGVRDNVLYATDDSRLCADLDKAATPSMEANSYVSRFKGESSAFVLNIEALTASPLIQMVAKQYGQEVAIIMTLVDKISYMECTASTLSGEGSLYFKDDKTNALKQIVDWGKSLAGM